MKPSVPFLLRLDFRSLRRAARAFVPLIIALAPARAAAAGAATTVTAGVVHERVSLPGRAAQIGYFGTHPDSPDGRTIAYIVYDRNPGPPARGYAPGALYVCDATLGNHVKIRDIAGIRSEDGASQIWLDDDTIAYMDYPPGRSPLTYVVRKNGDVVAGPFDANLGHGDAPHGAVPLSVDGVKHPGGSNLGPNGIYIYKGGTVTKAVDLAKDFGPLKSQLGGSESPGDWALFHAQLSTNGSYLSIRLDPKKGLEHLLTCRVDGTDARLFAAQKKPLHQQWYDDSTLFGHETIFKPTDGGPRHRAKRWDRNGKYLETLAGVGNHPGISPDRRYLASDNLYQLDPVVISLFRVGSPEPLAVIMSEAAGPVWSMRNHVNPAFSRDGRKLYFNKPVNGMTQVHRVDLSSLIHRGL